MSNVFKEIPEDHIAEITLIGTGGYGESSVVHLGNQQWIVFDSCINPTSKKTLPLEYLEEIGVDVKNNVKLIICSHWHDDHIRGLSQIVRKCESADLSFSKITDRTKFLQLIQRDYQKLKFSATNSSTYEFGKCLEIINQRGAKFITAYMDRTLLTVNADSFLSQVFSLSPSDQVISDFDTEISDLITEFGASNRKIIINSPNAKSVSLFLKLGSHRAILGSDLEVSSDSRKGWLNIIEESQVIDNKSTLFKIPHHGSENGYHDRIWNELLDKNPVAKITPYNLKTKLPSEKMLSKYLSLSDKLYITSDLNSNKPKKRSKSIEKMVNKFNPSIVEVKYKKGFIRCRINLIDKQSNWFVDTFGSAFQVNKNRS